MSRGEPQRRLAVGGLARDLDVVLGVEQRRNPARTSAWSSASSTRITAREEPRKRVARDADVQT